MDLSVIQRTVPDCKICKKTDWKIVHHLTERLAPLDVMSSPFRAPVKPFNAIV